MIHMLEIFSFLGLRPLSEFALIIEEPILRGEKTAINASLVFGYFGTTLNLKSIFSKKASIVLAATHRWRARKWDACGLCLLSLFCDTDSY